MYDVRIHITHYTLHITLLMTHDHVHFHFHSSYLLPPTLRIRDSCARESEDTNPELIVRTRQERRVACHSQTRSSKEGKTSERHQRHNGGAHVRTAARTRRTPPRRESVGGEAIRCKACGRDGADEPRGAPQDMTHQAATQHKSGASCHPDRTEPVHTEPPR